MTEFRVLTWREHIALSGEHLSQKLAKELREANRLASYEVTEDDVDAFLTPEVMRRTLWSRLENASGISVQWGESAGTILAIAGSGIDTSPMAVDLDQFNDQETNAVEALTEKIRPLLLPRLELMA